MNNNFSVNSSNNNNVNSNKNNDELELIIKNDDKIEWSVEHEKIFTEWGDKAMCYKWLHAKSHGKYRQLNTWYTIPVIVMSNSHASHFSVAKLMPCVTLTTTKIP